MHIVKQLVPPSTTMQQPILQQLSLRIIFALDGKHRTVLGVLLHRYYHLAPLGQFVECLHMAVMAVVAIHEHHQIVISHPHHALIPLHHSLLLLMVMHEINLHISPIAMQHAHWVAPLRRHHHHRQREIMLQMTAESQKLIMVIDT